MQYDTVPGRHPMQYLSKIPLFSDLDADDLNTLGRAAVTRKYPRNAVVLNDGDTTDAVYVIRSGQVRVSRINEEGREVVLAMMGEGDYFGEMALIDEQPRSATVSTKSACELVVIRKPDFQALLESNPQIGLAIMRGLCERLRHADGKIESLALMDVYGRISRALLEMAGHGEDDTLVIEEPVTHKELAQIVGSSREMVSRILKDLEKGGYIAKQGKQLIIRNRLPPAW